ncbi:MAG: molybdenum cofactor biosynthesis protein MoaE [Cystobacterineae bacterium]|nr:molybdenum cofactor biosynthesis protein MoaE [Cystobacterineae bacterium]
MAFEVLFFAAAREAAGKSKEVRALPCPATVAGAVEALCRDYPGLQPLLPYLRMALNGRFVEGGILLNEGDILALIPPIAGGRPRCRIVEGPLEAADFLCAAPDEAYGATLCFIGSVRAHSGARKVHSLHCEAFVSMAEDSMEAIADEVQRRWPGTYLQMTHRIGTLWPKEAIVVIAVASAHRQTSFEACAFALEELKRIVPIWKKESYEGGGEAWVGGYFPPAAGQ